MAEFEKWEMQDPFEVTARREARAQREEKACGSCIHKRTICGPRGDMGFQCVFRKRIYGIRCDLYKTELL